MKTLPSLRAACVQFCADTNCADNLAQTSDGIASAVGLGAQLVQLPEMANLMQSDKLRARDELQRFSASAFLEALQELALNHKIWLHVGSLMVPKKKHFRNRGYLIDADGKIRAHYDKIHLFDVDLANGESYRESATFRGGKQAVVIETPWGQLGMAICFDLRFGTLYHALAQAGATILTAPAAFTATTGAAHWNILVRGRAIEYGAIMLAACQGGHHADGRQTFGHSLIVDAWGTVLAEGSGEGEQCIVADLDPDQPAQARRMIPNLQLARPFDIVHQ